MTSILIRLALFAVMTANAAAALAGDMPVRKPQDISPPQEQGGNLVKVPPGTVARPQFEPPKDGAASKDELVVRPGVNEIVPIAHGHLNRFVTPFAKAAVKTTDDMTTEVDGQVVYVASKSATKATMFITPEGRQSPAISLTLVPRDVPPRELVLSLPGGMMVGAAAKDNPGAAPQASSYVEDIAATFKSVALQQVPQGYSYRPVQGGDLLPTCVGPDVTYSFGGGQLLAGTNHDVYIGLVSNQGPRALELREQWCVTGHVVAVAYWPRSLLQPGEKTEVYVMRRTVAAAEAAAPTRPSLLGGGQ